MKKKRRVFVYCPDINVPIGATKMLYRHVDVLRTLGYRAYALHRSPQSRYTWFANRTPIRLEASVRWEPTDFLVIPEAIAARVTRNFPVPKKIIFNQNCYKTYLSFFSLDLANRYCPYREPNVVASIITSGDGEEYLKFAFPGHPIFRLHYSVDPAIFFPGPKRKPRIAFMPRKNHADARQVFNILKYRGKLRGYGIEIIDGRSELEVAKALRESALFFSFGHPDGFSLPILEAMSCETIVVGYHGMGGREMMRPEFSYPVEVGDIVGFVRQAERAIDRWENERKFFRQQARDARSFVGETYSREREISDIERIWKDVTA